MHVTAIYNLLADSESFINFFGVWFVAQRRKAYAWQAAISHNSTQLALHCPKWCYITLQMTDVGGVGAKTKSSTWKTSKTLQYGGLDIFFWFSLY